MKRNNKSLRYLIETVSAIILAFMLVLPAMAVLNLNPIARSKATTDTYEQAVLGAELVPGINVFQNNFESESIFFSPTLEKLSENTYQIRSDVLASRDGAYDISFGLIQNNSETPTKIQMLAEVDIYDNDLLVIADGKRIPLISGNDSSTREFTLEPGETLPIEISLTREKDTYFNGGLSILIKQI